MTDVQLDGGGARLICHGPLISLALLGCRNVRVSNITVNWAIPMSAEGRIVDDQGDFIDVFIDTALFPCKVVNGRLTLMGGDRFRSDAQEALGEGLSGMVTGLDGLTAYYGWLQGFCFALPAYLLSYTIGRDPNYLRRLYDCLKRFDDYLWTYRDSDGDGCLESWCVWDTGEDNCSRFFEGSPEKSHL